MATKTEEKYTLKNRVVYDPITKRFIQKDHIVHGAKVLDYPVAKCKNCSKDYPKKRVDQSFCCTPCRLEWHTRKGRGDREPNLSPRACLICNTTFKPTREWAKYCSEKCRAKARLTKLRLSRELISIPLRNVKRICNYCGEEYTPLIANQKFCSRGCSVKFRRERYGELRVCEYCNNGYKTTVPSQKYCSRSCASKANSKQGIGVEEGKPFTEVERPRKRYCRICGHRAYSEHHITPRADGGSEARKNKVWLCRRCHDIVEQIYRDEDIKYCSGLVDRVRRILGPDKVKRNYYEKTTNKVFAG